MRKSIWAAVVALVLGAGSTRAMFVNNSVKVPVDRVVTNVEAWIKANPKDAQAYYVLGRIHAMAWAYGKELTLARPRGAGRGPIAPRGEAATAPDDADPFQGQLPGFTPMDSVEVRRDAQKTDASAEDLKHLDEAIVNYQKAVELDPKNPLYELGLAWVLQESGNAAANLSSDFGGGQKQAPTDAEAAAYRAAASALGNADQKVRDDATALLEKAMPKPLDLLRGIRNDNAEAMARIQSILKTYWDVQALEHFRRAYELRLAQDLKNGGGLRAGDSALAQEAGEAILLLIKAHPQAAKENEAREVAANVQTLKNKPMAVTPIIFALPGTPGEQVGDLVDSSKRVGFDLAGDQVARQWPWVKDGTGLLVWDPGLTGAITNGKQLFGDRTWWVFFRDGYQALSVLDDNRDGRLTGDELQGIAVWIDRNGDAVSQPGEVITLAQAGITAISVRSTDVGGTLSSEAGITFSDGRSVKSFDWVTRPIQEESVQKVSGLQQ